MQICNCGKGETNKPYNILKFEICAFLRYFFITRTRTGLREIDCLGETEIQSSLSGSNVV